MEEHQSTKLEKCEFESRRKDQGNKMKINIEQDSGIEVLRYILYPEQKKTHLDAMTALLNALKEISRNQDVTLYHPPFSGNTKIIQMGRFKIPYEVVKVNTSDGLLLDNIFIYYKKIETPILVADTKAEF